MKEAAILGFLRFFLYALNCQKHSKILIKISGLRLMLFYYLLKNFCLWSSMAISNLILAVFCQYFQRYYRSNLNKLIIFNIILNSNYFHDCPHQNLKRNYQYFLFNYFHLLKLINILINLQDYDCSDDYFDYPKILIQFFKSSYLYILNKVYILLF